MDKIANISDMEEIVEKYGEIVIYGAGNMGQVVIKELVKRGWRDRIVCCAVTNRFCNMREILDIPVIELKWMPHLRESSCFIVAVGEDKQTEIYESLVEFGCKNIKVMEYSYELELEMRQKMNKPSIEIIKEEILHLAEKINRIEHQIQEQNEICATNIEAFKRFENCNYGKDVIIVASGPTLKYYIPKTSALHIGMNFTWKRKDIFFDYFFIQDGHRKGKYREMLEGTLKNINGYIFIGKYLRRSPFREIEYPVLVNNEGRKIYRYWLEAGDFDIYQDICYHPLMDYGTVSFPVLQFALYTYPKRIYLVGCDVSTGGTFDTKTSSLSRCQLSRFKSGYRTGTLLKLQIRRLCAYLHQRYVSERLHTG